MCLFLAGCLQQAPMEDPPQEMETDMNVSDSMNILLSREYGNFMLKWTSPVRGGSDPLFDVEVVAEDPAYVPICPVKIRTYAPYADALELTGYYVQENDYDGNLYFRITASLDNETVLQEDSKLFATSDIIPARKELLFRTDIDPDDILSFSYSGTGDSVELIFSYGISVEDDGIIYRADFHDAKGKEHSVEKEISRDDWTALLEEITKGSMCLKHFRDPDLIMLDGSEERLTIIFSDMDPVVENLYSFIPEDREKLTAMLKRFAE